MLVDDFLIAINDYIEGIHVRFEKDRADCGVAIAMAVKAQYHEDFIHNLRTAMLELKRKQAGTVQ
jgi:hypothetical protein